jgi:hypothetical protein
MGGREIFGEELPGNDNLMRFLASSFLNFSLYVSQTPGAAPSYPFANRSSATIKSSEYTGRKGSASALSNCEEMRTANS